MNQNKSQFEILDIFKICREIELSAAELYTYYSEIYNKPIEIANLWKKTAKEEENHANQFSLAINLYRQDLVESIDIDKFTAETILRKIIVLIEAVKKSKPTIADALSSAIKLEGKLAEFHLTAIASFQTESQRKLFDSMMNNDKGHVTALNEAYKSICANSKA